VVVKLSHERFVGLLASLKSRDGIETEQRRRPRVGLRASVLVAPLEESGEPGATYAVKVQDLSAEGVSFQHFRGLRKGQQFVIDVPESEDGPTEAQEAGGRLRILCRVIHCRSAGEHQFVVGAQFVRLWTTPAPTLDAARAAA
jgi:hypothetical protein